MTDSKLLYELIEMKGVKLKTLCDAAGFSYSTFSRKANNENEFTVSEVNIISKELGLSQEERDRIFFACERD